MFAWVILLSLPSSPISPRVQEDGERSTSKGRRGRSAEKGRGGQIQQPKSPFPVSSPQPTEGGNGSMRDCACVRTPVGEERKEKKENREKEKERRGIFVPIPPPL